MKVPEAGSLVAAEAVTVGEAAQAAVVLVAAAQAAAVAVQAGKTMRMKAGEDLKVRTVRIEAVMQK